MMKKDIWSGPGAFLPELEKMASLISSVEISGQIEARRWVREF